ncbi:hypothetical protein WJX72_009103 [[Myrmecia] bisecta]|uniref:Uncharacterized protein n=1 Tax=[Myrmecia] bisecta TaxID=41462 RepID=A0AAW1Q2T8_9CHLO
MMQALPVELCQLIAQKQQGRDLCSLRALQLVSKQWRCAVQHAVRELFLAHHKLQTPAHLEMLQRFCNVAQVALDTATAGPATEAIAVSGLQFAACLTTLELGSLDFVYEDTPEVIARLTGLPSLRFKFTRDTADPELDVQPLLSLSGLRCLELRRAAVSDFGPFAAFTGLQTLTLQVILEDDSSLTPFAALTGLQVLKLTSTYVQDVMPLTNLSSLRDLDLSDTSVHDATPLATMTNLLRLDLSGLPDVVFDVAGLTQLQFLNLSGTRAREVGTLAALTNLTRLDLHRTSVTDVQPLAALTCLSTLNIGSTDVADIAALTALCGLTSLGLGQLELLANIQPLAALTALECLNLT